MPDSPTAPALAPALLLALCAAFAPSPAAAGGWTQPQDAYYLKVWGRLISGDRAYDADGGTVGTQAFTDLQLNVYGEYGLTDTWTLLFFGVPTGYATALTDTFYVGPLGVGARRALSTADLRLAAELRYALSPGVGDADLLVAPGDPSGQVRYVPAIGNHAGDLELQAGHGLSFGWVTLSAGMRFNSADGIDHAVLGGAQLGWQLDAWQLDVHVQTYQPLGGIDVVNAAGVGQTRYVGVGLGVGYRFGDSVGAVVAADGGAARSNAAAASFQAGFEFN